MLNDNPSQPPAWPSPTLAPQVITWARQAGQIALRYFNRVVASYKSDQSLVTQADVEIEQFLAQQIHTAYPEHGLLGEEGAYRQANPTRPYIWVIDPVDGTTVFTHGLPGWGISIGLLYNGQPVFGLFYMPLLDDLTYTTMTSLTCNQSILNPTVRSAWLPKGFLAVSAGAHYDFDIRVPQTRALGSVGASLVYTARGSATAAFIPKAYLWDLAAAALILNRAGGELRYLSGQPVVYADLLDGRLAPQPILAGCPDLLHELQHLIRPLAG